MGIRLNKVITELNIGLQTAIEFLRSNHIGDLKVDAKPATKISDVQYKALVKKFSADKRIKANNNKLSSRIDEEKRKGDKKIKDEDKKKEKGFIKKNKNNKYDPVYDGYKVKVLAITDTGSIITSGNSDFDYGIIFQNGILYNSTPLPIDISSNFASSNIIVGKFIRIYVSYFSKIEGKKVAISTIEISGRNDDDEEAFHKMEVGKTYHLTVFDYNDVFVTLRVPGTSLRGYIDAKAIENPEVGQEYDLRLSKKGNSVFQFMKFALEVSDSSDDSESSQEVDAEASYYKMFEKEASIISEENKAAIVKLLEDYPNTDRNKKYLADISHLYCRYTPQTYIKFEEFCRLYPNYIADHNFFITCDKEEQSFTIFDSEYVVFKLYGDGDCLWLREFFYGKNDIRAKYICDRNKKNKLIIEGSKIHILDSYNAIPYTFDWKAIMEYTSRMSDFFYNILKKIDFDFYKKQTAETKEFVVLRDLIRFEKDLEEKKEGQKIKINETYPIERTTALEYDPGVAYKFKLDSSDYEKLCGIMEPDEELFVSIYDPTKNDKPVRNGKMFYDEDSSIARIEFRNDTHKDLLRFGYLKKRISTEHLEIQIEAINTLFRVREKKFQDSIVPSSFKEPDISKYQDVEFFDENIKNAATGNNQPLAVKKALGNKQVLLIQGPPGTGKTTVIIEIIRQLAKEGKKVLVCSQTHAAVRNIIDKLSSLKDELSFISIENDGEEEAWGSGFNIEEYKSFLANNRNLIQLLNDNEEVDSDYIQKSYKYNSRNGDKYISYHNYILEYYKQSKELYQNADGILSHLLSESELSGYLLDSYRYQIQDVILGTCIGIGMNRNVREMHFDTVIIDEAAKANLAESLVPMKLGDRFILVGDDKQLPPYMDRQMVSDFVKDSNNKRSTEDRITEAEVVDAISKSLFELYHDKIEADSESVVMLNYQYRMHPEIGNFISDVFYDGKVNMGENTVSQFISLPEPYSDPIHFVDTDMRPDHWEKRIGQSFINVCEANLISQEILPLINQAGLSKDVSIAIITPYSAQREYLKNLLKDSKHYNSIYTIDSIQGMEFDIVIFSFVRSFSSKYNKVVGFLDDMRRLNVSLSRAKKKLILVGNKPTLTRPEAHRGGVTTVINPVMVFEKLSQSYIQYDNPNKARLFHDKYNEGDEILCSVIRIEDKYLYFNVKENLDFVFRKPLELYEIRQLEGATEVMMAITEYSRSLQPYFTVLSYLHNGELVKLQDFDDATRNLYCGMMISCTLTKKGRIILADYNGFDCMIPDGAYNRDFLDDTNVGDTIQARVFIIDKEKHLILIFPILSSYEESIKSGELKHFFFTVEEKFAPDELALTFDNGESAYFIIASKFLWYSLLEDEIYCDFQGDYEKDDRISYNYWRKKIFRQNHPSGDVVKAHVTYIDNMCIAWSEGVVTTIEDFRGKGIKVGKDYDVTVSYGEKGKVLFKLPG